MVSVGLYAVSFPADPPGAEQSWHAEIHDRFYPLIPVGILASMALATRSKSGAARPKAAGLMMVLTLAAFVLTGTDSVGQLARYLAFALVSYWLWAMCRALRAGSNTVRRQ